MADWIDRVTGALRRARPPAAREEVRVEHPPTRAVPAGVTIEYTPQLDGDPDPGEIVWAWVPYEDDPTLGKDRPVVVIGRRGAALCGVALSTKRHGHDVEVGTGSWDGDGRTSYAKVERLLDVDPAEVRREGAILERARFDALVAAVDALHDVRR